MNQVLLSMTGITKLYPGTRALYKVDFDLKSGEVHILMGENGAGKSTLGKVLLGFTPKTDGKIFYNGKEINFKSTKEALDNGIAAVYQELTLVPYLSVAQNIFLNREPRGLLGFIDMQRMERDAAVLLQRLNCDNIDVKTKTKFLSVAQQQMVEIAKALSHKSKIIVFDEPTATLSKKEVESLFAQIKELKSNGLGIVYISHRIEEFRKIGDRFTVLRDGEKIFTGELGDYADVELVKMMVGRDITQFYDRHSNISNEVVLQTNNLCSCDGKVDKVSIKLKKGEIVGLCGLMGAGRTETAETLYGIRKIRTGTITIKGKTIFRAKPAKMLHHGLGLVTEDRKRFGLALNESIKWNVVGVSLCKYCPYGILNMKLINKTAENYRKQLRIAADSIEKPCRSLSGGNQQKVVLAKWFSQNPDILIFDEPTRGIDVGTKKEIYDFMDELTANGKSILMISSELPELIGMSDRVYVMRDGSIVFEAVRGSEQFNAEQIGFQMLVGR